MTDRIRTTCNCELCQSRSGRPRLERPDQQAAYTRVACPRCSDRIRVDELQAHLETCQAQGGF